MKTNLDVKIAIDEYGKDLTINLSRIRHLLVAGATGSGKSVLLHKILSTLLENNSPTDLQLLLTDPKRVELAMYNGVSHLLTPVMNEPKKAILALRWALKEMDRRYDIFSQNKCKSIDEYQGQEIIPRLLIVIDEFSDIMYAYPKETEPLVLKIAQMGHVVGIHMIISSSRPHSKVFPKSVCNVITSRVALQTSSAIDSRFIIGTDEAYKLQGKGDMLFREGLKYFIHAQIIDTTESDIKALVKKLSSTYKDYLPEVAKINDTQDVNEDELYEEARQAVIEAGKASTSYIQRKLGIGYSRSAQLMDLLEQKGIIGPANGSTPREVIPNTEIVIH